MEQVCLVSKYNGKTEDNFLPNLRSSSVVSEPTSIGIESVSSLSTITLLRKKDLEGNIKLIICLLIKVTDGLT